MHVRVETRKVYVSARGPRLTKHAAYIGAAKKLIADKCAEISAKRWPGDEPCHMTSSEDRRCRFHASDIRIVEFEPGLYEEEVEGIAYYRHVLPRLVRFLKFVDARKEPRNA